MAAMLIVNLTFQPLQGFSATRLTGQKIRDIPIVNLQCVRFWVFSLIANLQNKHHVHQSILQTYD